MAYTVRLESRAEEELRVLPQSVLKRIDAKLRSLADNPRPRGVVKLSGLKGEGWRVRVGDYRILYRIRDDIRVIEVYRIKHRREAYRK
jgi:mRNA interferase RelE/StbE